MRDHTRLVFDALAAAGFPDAKDRAEIYRACRAEVTSAYPDAVARAMALEDLEKAIRRQEIQALHEEGSGG